MSKNPNIYFSLSGLFWVVTSHFHVKNIMASTLILYVNTQNIHIIRYAFKNTENIRNFRLVSIVISYARMMNDVEKASKIIINEKVNSEYINFN